MISLDWADYLTAYEGGSDGNLLGGNNHYLTIFQVLILQSHPTKQEGKRVIITAIQQTPTKYIKVAITSIISFLDLQIVFSYIICTSKLTKTSPSGGSHEVFL